MQQIIRITLFVAVFSFGMQTLPTLAMDDNQQTCSRQDEREIRSFNRKARKKQIKMEELRDEMRPQRGDPEDLEDITREMRKVEGFYSSPEYEAMKPVYARCGRTIPKLSSGYEPFWLPTN